MVQTEGGVGDRIKCMYSCSELITESIEACLYICLSVYLSVCMFAFLSVCLSAYLFVCLSICLSLYLTIRISVLLTFCLYACLSACLSVGLYFCQAVRLPLSVCLSICLIIKISAFNNASSSKFGMKVYVNCPQIKLNFGYHAHRSRKSLFKFLKSIWE